MPEYRFPQVDVFSAHGMRGNPLAVVHDADGLGDDEMAAFARWTNLSETTFLLAPTVPGADYRVRIFTGSGELPFAGHPTLAARQRELLGLTEAQVLGVAWIDNGPGWIGVELGSAEEVLALRVPDGGDQAVHVGVVGRWADPAAAGKDVEVRAFFGEDGRAVEDPVNGSLNAGLAQWLIGAGRLPERYVAGQGARLGRDGRVYVERADGEIWVGGDVVTTVRGAVRLG